MAGIGISGCSFLNQTLSLGHNFKIFHGHYGMSKSILQILLVFLLVLIVTGSYCFDVGLNIRRFK